MLQELVKKAGVYFNPDFAKAFARSAEHTIGTTIQKNVRMGQTSVENKSINRGDIIARLAMTEPSAPLQCHLEISFNKETALYISNSMFGGSATEISQEVKDVACEMTNMIYCNARKSLNERGQRFQMAIPQVRMSSDARASHPEELRFVIPLTIGDQYAMWIELSVFELTRALRNSA